LSAPRGWAKAALLAAARSGLGRRALASVANTDPQLVVEALGPRVNRRALFASVREWPERIQGFEDLAFLFSSHQLHHAVISMTVDEAAFLYRLARALPTGSTIVEIGRYKGGGTFLLAAARRRGVRLVSYDVEAKRRQLYPGVDLDAALRDALERYDLSRDVDLLVADSQTAPPPADRWELVVVDGDHSYRGVRADYERWRTRLAPRGHLVFHDAGEHGPLSVAHVEIARLMREIESDDRLYLEQRGGAGTLVAFERTTEPAPWDDG
jgi:predicted O-methyltransferase YrrM